MQTVFPLPPAIATALASAYTAEQQLVSELTTLMLRQRAAIAADDLQAVHDSVFATHRLLLSLGETRKRRHAITRLLRNDEAACAERGGERGRDPQEHQQLQELGGAPAALREQRAALQAAARQLSTEIDANRRILRNALVRSEGAQSGDASGRGVTLDATLDATLDVTRSATHGVTLNAQRPC